MTPQPRGIVPADHQQLLLAARDLADSSAEAYRVAVADALKAGGSVREVAKVTGLSTRTVREWGEARGWPTPEQRAAREAVRERNRAWNDMIERGTKELGSGDE